MYKDKNYRTLLEKVFNEKIEELGISKARAYEQLGCSKSTVSNVWQRKNVSSTTYKQFARFLEIEEAVVFYLNEKISISNKYLENEARQEKKWSLALKVGFVIWGFSMFFGFFIWNKSKDKMETQRTSLCSDLKLENNTQVFKTSFNNGFGEDLDPNIAHTDFKNFNPALYEYKFEDFNVKTIGEYIEIDISIQWYPKSDKENIMYGQLHGCGIHFDGRAAIAYKVKDTEGTQEQWIGTLMMDMPRSGSVYGYFLTSHTDTGKSLFLLGSAKAHR